MLTLSINQHSSGMGALVHWNTNITLEMLLYPHLQLPKRSERSSLNMQKFDGVLAELLCGEKLLCWGKATLLGLRWGRGTSHGGVEPSLLSKEVS